MSLDHDALTRGMTVRIPIPPGQECAARRAVDEINNWCDYWRREHQLCQLGLIKTACGIPMDPEEQAALDRIPEYE